MSQVINNGQIAHSTKK